MTGTSHPHSSVASRFKNNFLKSSSAALFTSQRPHFQETNDPYLPFAVSFPVIPAAIPAAIRNFTMGKSNKFDFTNRNNSGARLGKSIGQALEKEAIKVQKDAEKEAAKPRRQRANSYVSPDAKDAEEHAHRLDLQAPNKHLGDDGVAEVVKGLQFALSNGTTHTCLTLEDLNLTGNEITTESLSRLAPIIELAKHDLKTLNLSNNNIVVETEIQAIQWQTFLKAFKGCFRLRRLDLSGNTELGSRSLEIFARTHLSEEAIAPISIPQIESVHSLLLQNDTGLDSSSTIPNSSSDMTEYGKSMENGMFLTRRRGLRSIPFIELENVGLSDASALWLSYILEDHYYPMQLIDELNATSAHSNINAYQQEKLSKGIEWKENEGSLGKDGLFLLQKTESVRYTGMLLSQEAAEDTLVMQQAESGREIEGSEGRVSMERKTLRTTGLDRRFSLRSVQSADGGLQESSEVESSRKKLQRHAIEYSGASKVELWSSALKLVKYSRMLDFIAPVIRIQYIGEGDFTALLRSAAKSPSPPSFEHTKVRKVTTSENSDPMSFSAGNMQRKESYAEKLTSPKRGLFWSSSAGLAEISNSPTTPKRVFKPRRKSASSEGNDLPAMTKKLRDLVVRTPDLQSFVQYQEKRIARASAKRTVYRDPYNPGDLPRAIIERIINFAGLGSGAESMTQKQKDAAFQWGSDRMTLHTEMEWRKKDDSSQVWMLLDGIGCLTYEQ